MADEPILQVGRRTFLTAFALSSVATACAKSSDPTTGPVRVSPAQPAMPSTPLVPNSFALGVASGDPTASAVVLWTRLCSSPLEDGGGSPTGPVEVAYDVATDAAFGNLVASGLVTANEGLAHSVHVDVTGLAPDQWYFYRFRAGDQTSAVGRTRTVPEPGEALDRFTFAVASCQDYQWGTYVAWKHAAAEPELDAVVFLGDYIYELSLGDLSPTKDGSRVWKSPPPTTLSQYRWRYAQTKSDPDLQAAHHRAPWIVTWDDHEVSNNYEGDVGQGDVDQPNSRDRRLAAYQAWYEHVPVRIDPQPTQFDKLDLYRNFDVGSLIRFHVIEVREFGDPPPCRTGPSISDDGPDCPERNDPERTNLGAAQEAWLSESLKSSQAKWNVLCNPLMFAGCNIGTPEAPQYTRDTWDGYTAARQRVIKMVTDHNVSNPVVVTGDWHASFVLDVKAAPGEPTIMPEFLFSSISTVIFGTDYTANNPHIRYFDDDHAYGLVTITPDVLECKFRRIADVWDRNAQVVTDTFQLTAGSHEPTRK